MLAIQSSEFVAHITEAPTIEIRDGVAHVRDRSGNLRIDRAMSIKSFAKYVERGRRALERHAAGDAIIVVDD